MYYWLAQSDDGCFTDLSVGMFDTQKEAYENMRNAALEKMKWNTEFDEDFYDVDAIDYKVVFYKDKIVHSSYSGTYTYTIYKKGD